MRGIERGRTEKCTDQRLGIKAKKCLSEGVIISTTLYGAEACGMRSAERRKVNVLEMKFLRSLVGVSRLDNNNNNNFIKTRLQDTIGKIIKYRWLG